jgi:hypothetical protein
MTLDSMAIVKHHISFQGWARDRDVSVSRRLETHPGSRLGLVSKYFISSRSRLGLEIQGLGSRLGLGILGLEPKSHFRLAQGKDINNPSGY